MPTDDEIEDAARRLEIWADNVDPATVEVVTKMNRTERELEEAVKALEDFDPATARQVDGSDIRAIAVLVDQGSQDEALLAERVAIARAHGHSWNIIAVALGVSRQVAQERFGGKTDV